MKNVALLLSLIVLISKIQGQTFSNHTIAITPKEYPDGSIDLKLLKNRLNQRLNFESDTNRFNNYYKIICDDQSWYLKSNEIYKNWEQATNYVREVFLKIIPKNIDNKDIKVFVVRSPDVNAYCMEDGNIAVTVGFLSTMKSEAQLASTLGHEFGHYIKCHNYQEYLDRLELKENYSMFFFSNQETRNYYKKQRNAERQADTISIDLLLKSGYNSNSIIEKFLEYDKIEEKYKNLKSYRSQYSYLSTHPSNSDRIKSAKNLIKNSNTNSIKNFMVDSSYFFKLKYRAVDECIFLLYDQLRFDECIELSFINHLKNPNDEFFLYFLIASLHAQNQCLKDFNFKPFITHNYNLKNINSSFKVVKYNIIRNIYEQENYFKNSVFNNLCSPIFNIDSTELKQFLFNKFWIKDTIPFYTNKEAYSYFKEKVKHKNGAFNLLKTQFNIETKPENLLNKNYNELENEFLDINNCYKSFNSKWDSLENAIVFVSDIRFVPIYSSKRKYYRDLTYSNKFYHEEGVFLKNYSFKNLIKRNNLNFKEANKINSIYSYISGIGEESFYSGTVSIDFFDLCPEFIAQSIKNNLECIYFIELELVTGITSYNPYGPSPPKSKFIIYNVDLKNKKISKREVESSRNYNGGSFHFILEELYKECESMIKN